jgi:hypothetical protein
MSESTKTFDRLLITWFQNKTGYSVDKIENSETGYIFYFTHESGVSFVASYSAVTVYDEIFSSPEVENAINEMYADSMAKQLGYMSPDDFAEAFTNIVGMDIEDDDFDRYITWYESGDHGLNDYDFLKGLQDTVDLDTQIKLFLEDVGC